MPFWSYCRNGDRRSIFNTSSKRIRLVNNYPLSYFLHKIFFSWRLIPWYWKNISKPNSWVNRYTSIFVLLHRHIIGIHFLGKSVGHIQRTITLSISIEIMQNLCSSSSSKCVLCKIFRRHPKIRCLSKIIVETVTEGHFSTHFPSEYGSWITIH